MYLSPYLKERPMKSFLFLIVLSLFFSTRLSAQIQKEKLSLEHYADYEWASNPQISPDGTEILYSRSWINLTNDKRETDLWIMKAHGSKNPFFRSSARSWFYFE